MKKAINAWAFPCDMTFEDIFKAAKSYGFEAIELNVDAVGASNHSFSYETTDEELAEVVALSKKYNLDVRSISSGLYWSCGAFADKDPTKREEALKVIRTQLRCAKGIGADSILVVTCVGAGLRLKESFDNTIEVFKSLKDEIASYNVKIGLENVWNEFFSSPYDVKYVLDGIGDENVGLYFDIGNVIEFSDAEWWIDAIGKYIVKVHVKDFKRAVSYRSGGECCDLLEGNVNWEAVVPMLARYYDGPMTAELFKGARDAEEFFPKVSSALDTIIAMANKSGEVNV